MEGGEHYNNQQMPLFLQKSWEPGTEQLSPCPQTPAGVLSWPWWSLKQSYTVEPLLLPWDPWAGLPELRPGRDPLTQFHVPWDMQLGLAPPPLSTLLRVQQPL